MIKHTVSVLIADSDHYFSHGLSTGIKNFCRLRGLSLRLINRTDLAKNGVDIVFLGNSVTCPPWLFELYQQGCTPHVFFIREQERLKQLPAPIECGAGILYRHQPMQAIEALLNRALYLPEEGASFAGKCRCTSALTHREAEVLQCLALGMSGHDTAGHLGIHDKTVHAHKRNAMRKLSIKSNQELYQWMAQGGVSGLNRPTQRSWLKYPKPAVGW